MKVELKRTFTISSNNKMSIWNKMTGLLDYNPASLSGCIDVIVAENESGQLKSTPFHIRVGKFKLFKSTDQMITLKINGVESEHHMKISKTGVGYWEIEADKDELEEDGVDIYSDEESKPDQNDDKNILKSSQNKIKSETKLEESKETESPPKEEEATKIKEKEPSVYPLRKMSESIKDDMHIKRERTIDDMTEVEDKIEMSICGHLLNEDSDKKTILETFSQNKVEFSQFDRDPYRILDDERLMIKVGRRIYDRHIGVPQIFSLLSFDSELTPFSIAKLKKDQEQEFEDLQGEESVIHQNEGRKFRKSLKPKHEVLSSLKLREGLNELEYHFIGNMDTPIVLKSRIFFYKYAIQRRIIISDIDGTITRSDVLGHVMPFLSQDWSHQDICDLFTKLASRGYIMIYLTARNIGLFAKTLNYLKSVKQKGLTLPEGPIVTSPDSLLESFKREMIIKNPEVFKIQVLRDIKQVFGETQDYNPIFAGFGNKDTDAIAYRVISIPKRRVFIINPKGDIYNLKTQVTVSYGQLATNLEEDFPPFDSNRSPDEEPIMRRQTMYDIADLKNSFVNKSNADL